MLWFVHGVVCSLEMGRWVIGSKEIICGRLKAAEAAGPTPLSPSIHTHIAAFV